MSEEKNFSRLVDILIKIGVLILLLSTAFLILLPFLYVLLWGVIIAVVLHPTYDRLKKFLRGRGRLAATLITLILLGFIIAPVLFLSDSIVDSFDELSTLYKTGDLVIPPPGDHVKDWPGFAKPVADTWQLASENLVEAVAKYQDEIKVVIAGVLAAMAQVGMGVLQFLIAIIIAGVLLSYGAESTAAMQKVFTQLAGSSGDSLMKLSEVTIRNTVKGVLGVAIIQSLMAGGGMIVAGIPFAGLWFLACIILATLQIGVLPVLLPAVIYMYVTREPFPATMFLVWSIICLVSDNVLKPFLLGRNAPAPMLVVFLGAIGGFISFGFLGLFLGPVILSLAYTLLISWMTRTPEGIPAEQPPLAG